MGRTEQFTEVAFDSERREGEIVKAIVTGHTDTQLTAA
jgi:threonylcarbamoyladenosine tRNA methylthiotransferase MtaB